MKRILALGAALLMILCGCGEEPAVPARKVTDAQELEQLWQEYFSMALLPLQDEFTAPEDIDPNDLADTRLCGNPGAFAVPGIFPVDSGKWCTVSYRRGRTLSRPEQRVRSKRDRIAGGADEGYRRRWGFQPTADRGI